MDFEENRPAQDVPLEENIEQTQDERTAQETQQNEAARREKQYETFTMLLDLVYILAGITLVFVFFFRLVGVDGSSMYPTLVDHDYLVLESNFLYRSVHAGDIVVIDPPEEAGFSGPIVKRVIATGGQTVDIDFDAGVVYVDGEALEESYVFEPTYRSFREVGDGLDYPVTVPEGSVFVLGDNRNHSADSRYAKLGCVDESRILGRVLLRIIPGRQTNEEGDVVGGRNFRRHMTKTRRMMEEDLKLVDAVCEILDARIPISSRNPDIDAICGKKPRMVILNRIDMADADLVSRWSNYFKDRGMAVIRTDCKSRKGINTFAPAVRQLLAEKLQRYAEKGQVGRPLKLMVVGIPNVGKSTFINQIAGRKGAKAENRPGVTRGKQWVNVDGGLLLLDTPGILWPKFDDPEVGMRLAYTGAVKDDVLDTETLGCHLMELLAREYPGALTERYKIEIPAEIDGWELLQAAGRKRGFLVSGGEVDTERMARVLLDEYRSCKLGTFTLERPAAAEQGADA